MTAYDWADSSQISVADPDYLEALDPTPVKPKARRGTSNGNVTGSAKDRRNRRQWLLETYRADVDLPLWWTVTIPELGTLYVVPRGTGQAACRCYRCGVLLTLQTLTVDRIIPGAFGGKYTRDNIRPSCAGCAEETSREVQAAKRAACKHKCPDCRREDPDNKRRPRKLVEWSGVARCATHAR